MIRAFLAVVLTVLALAMSPALAQDAPLPDYGRWDRVATQAEQLTGNGDTATAQLESIRADIVDWRLEGEDIALTWRETGGAPPAQPQRKGFGSMLMTSSARQLGGEIDRQFGPDGALVTMRFPAAG